MQENFVIFLSMIIANMHNPIPKSRPNYGANRQTTRFSAFSPPILPAGGPFLLCNLYNRPSPGGPTQSSTRICWVVTRDRQMSALPSRRASSMGTAVIWLLS